MVTVEDAAERPVWVPPKVSAEEAAKVYVPSASGKLVPPLSVMAAVPFDACTGLPSGRGVAGLVSLKSWTKPFSGDTPETSRTSGAAAEPLSRVSPGRTPVMLAGSRVGAAGGPAIVKE